MTLPRLKRMRVSTEQELRNWISKNHLQDIEEVLIVTCSKKSPKKYVSSAQVRDVLREKGWTVSRSYTLEGSLVGHVARAI